MNSRIFINEKGEGIESYAVVHLSVKNFIEIIEEILEKNPVAGGYMVRHSKFKGVSYNSDDEYVDQFITLYVPPKKKGGVKKDAGDSSVDNKSKEDNESSEEVAKEDIHEFSFETKHCVDTVNKIVYICDPGRGNRISLNSALNMLNKVVSEDNVLCDYIIKYKNDNMFYEINEIWVNSAKKSIKFY